MVLSYREERLAAEAAFAPWARVMKRLHSRQRWSERRIVILPAVAYDAFFRFLDAACAENPLMAKPYPGQRLMYFGAAVLRGADRFIAFGER